MIHQYSKESVADFVFHFRATCLKIADMAEVEKLDRFARALVPKIRLAGGAAGASEFPRGSYGC